MTAAAARKLQKEIENVLKKAEDGITEFADYYDQATSATNAQQKERLGEELKKSINKLQRFRAQIREWIAQNQIASLRDKLEDARKRIENDMQRFKDFERELKTKAFSTCALAKQDELELEEEEKLKYQEWLTSTIQVLQDQLDQAEADLEVLEKKRSLSSDEKSRREFLHGHNTRHRWHIGKLEHLLRAVDNDAISISDLAIVRDSVDMYVEEHDSPDQYHDEQLYDCFDLAEFEAQAMEDAAETIDGSNLDGQALASGTQSTQSAGSSSKKASGSGKDSVKEAKKASSSKKEKELERKEKLASAKSKGTGDESTASRTGSGSKPTGPATRVSEIGGSSGRNQDALGSGSKSNKTYEERDRSAAVDLWDPADREGDDDVKVQEDQLINDADEFICKICQVHVVSCGPLLSSCSHLFCGDCIRQWFNQHPQVQTWAQRAQYAGQQREVPCPVCKNPLKDKESLFAVSSTTTRSENLLLWRMLCALTIACANHPKVKKDGRCDWVGELGQFQAHIRKCQDRPCKEYMQDDEIPELTKERYGDREQGAGGTPAAAPKAQPAKPQAQGSLQKALLCPPAAPAAVAAAAPATEKAAPTRDAIDRQGEASSRERVSDQPSQSVEPAQPAVQQPQVAALRATPVVAPAEQQPSQQVSSTHEQPNQPNQPNQPDQHQPVAQVAQQAAPKQVEKPNAPQAASQQGAAVVQSPASPAAQQTVQSPGHANIRHALVTFIGSEHAPGQTTTTVDCQVGDRLWVQESCEMGWAYVRNLEASPAAFGWVPSWVIWPQTESAQPAAPQQQPVQPEPAPRQAAKAAQHCQPLAYNGKVPERLQAARDFEASLPAAGAESAHISVKKGDWLDVCDRHPSGWTFGRVLKDPSSYERGYTEGWFPDWVTTSTSSTA